MAGALLEIVIENLGSFVQEQLATFWGVEQHAQKLRSNLTALRAVLNDAEKKQITRRDDAVKDWLQKLTDAAYVLDDILDEYQSPHGLSRFNPKAFLFRRNIGKRMKDISSRFHHINEERRTFELRSGVTEKHGDDDKDDDWRQTSSIIPAEHIVYGRDKDRETIVEFLLGHSDEEDLCIYPIVGMGGLGKTTLAKEIFHDGRVCKHFDLPIWVCVSDDFNAKTILQSIVESVTGQNPNLKTLEAMQKKVQEVLQSKRYLLVLDDVWNEDPEKWKTLKGMLQCAGGTKGATILVTTRLPQAASIMETQPAHHLMGLSEDDGWSLFKHQAFGTNREEREELAAIGKEIVKKCVGSPQANLISKKELNRLILSWSGNADSDCINVNPERVLEALEPPTSLKSFEMNAYRGTQLPNWMRNPSVLNELVEVTLNSCVNCEQLPPFGKLPHLKSLSVCGMKNVECIDGDSYDGVEKAFPSLEKFTARGLPNLKRMLRDEGVEMLPRLSSIRIHGLSNVKFPRLPSAEHLLASDVEDATSFMEGVVGKMPCLKTLSMWYFRKLKVLPDQLSSQGVLQELTISNCDELEYLPEHVLQGLTSLRTFFMQE